MIDINELRRLAQAATPGPWFSDARGNIWRRPLSDLYENGGSVAGDKPIAFAFVGWRGEGVTGYPVENNARLIAASNPSAVTELLDRLEAAEKDIALKERIIDSLGSELNAVANERDALLARIREMERQEPVAWLHETRRDSDVVTNAVKHVWGKAVVGSLAAYSIPLYLAPGAQPAPSEKDEPIRKAWARFSNALHRSPDAPYPGMSEAFEKHFSQSFTDREWRAESGTWAAAWKAAKNHGAQPAPSFADAYQGAMEEVAIWKKRALEAEDLNRKFIAEINGPTYMGEPTPSAPEDVMRDAERYRYLRARDDGTAGVGCWIEAEGRVCDRGWLYGVQLDSAIDSFIEVLAAAPKPEAKP